MWKRRSCHAIGLTLIERNERLVRLAASQDTPWASAGQLIVFGHDFAVTDGGFEPTAGLRITSVSYTHLTLPTTPYV